MDPTPSAKILEDKPCAGACQTYKDKQRVCQDAEPNVPSVQTVQETELVSITDVVILVVKIFVVTGLCVRPSITAHFAPVHLT